MDGEEDEIVAVTDASVIINFSHIEKLDMLPHLPGLRFVVPEQVAAELTDRAQAAELRRLIEDGQLESVVIGEPAEIERYAELTETLGKGESACLALAESRGWSVASDERRVFRLTAMERIGEQRLLTTPALIVRAIHARLATVAQADNWKTVLEHKRFTMKFVSFSGLV